MKLVTIYIVLIAILKNNLLAQSVLYLKVESIKSTTIMCIYKNKTKVSSKIVTYESNSKQKCERWVTFNSSEIILLNSFFYNPKKFDICNYIKSSLNDRTHEPILNLGYYNTLKNEFVNYQFFQYNLAINQLPIDIKKLLILFKRYNKLFLWEWTPAGTGSSK
jgi:hypothetical protein